jgi:hypothetical protein
VCYGDAGLQQWEPLAAGSDTLERDEASFAEEPLEPTLFAVGTSSSPSSTSSSNSSSPSSTPSSPLEHLLVTLLHLLHLLRLPPHQVDRFETDAKLGAGAAEVGWVIQEAYRGAHKAGNWRYVSPRGLKFKTRAEAVEHRAAGGDVVPRVRLVMSRGGAVEGGGASGAEPEGGEPVFMAPAKAPAREAHEFSSPG